MSVFEDFRRRARATWASADWDSCARLEPVGAIVLNRIDLRPGLDLVDVGDGHGRQCRHPGCTARGQLVGVDIAPELFERARRRAAEAGVDVEWVEGDAQELPVADETVELTFASEQDAVDEYVNTFGPFVTARTVLEPQGRWPEFVQAFADLIRRFDLATDGTARIEGAYLLITVDR